MNRIVSSRGFLRGALLFAACCVSLVAQTVTLSPTADAYVRSGANQNTNYGSAATLELKKSATATDDFNREIYLKFDLTNVTSVRSATLRVYGTETAPEAVNTDLFAAANTAWTEGGLTWANKPATGPMLWSNTALGGTAQYYEWDVTPYLAAEKIQGRNIVTLVLKNAVASTTGNITFNSQQNGSNKPQLVIVQQHPWTYYEAEAGTRSSGTTLQTGTAWGQMAFEARGKKAVTLDAVGENVAWTNVKAASHATVRYSVPDATTGTLALYVNNVFKVNLPLSSAGLREFHDTGSQPPDGIVRYFEDVMVAVPGGIPAGATVKLQKDVSGSTAYTIDFLEVEAQPAAGTKPDATWVSVAQGTGDDRAAIVAAIATANSGSKKVWLPAGTYTINLAGGPSDGGIAVPSGVQIRGAGMWHTTLVQNYGGNNRRLFSLGGSNTVQDFKVIGTITTITDNGQYVVFRAGDNSSGHLIERIWAEKVTLFLGVSVQNCSVRNCRVRNTYKDSIHFAQNAVNNVIEFNAIRNSGDDNVALVSYEKTGMADNTIQYNLGECGWWGRGFTNIGGDGNIMRYNVAVDCTKAGIACMIETYNDKTTPFATNWVVEKNVAIRCGNQNDHPLASAIAIYVGGSITTSPMSGEMEENLVVEPPYAAARLQGRIGTAGTGDLVTFRANGLPLPTVGTSAWHVRKRSLPAANSNLVDTPNYDL
jgi:hypothetical protein